MEYKYRRYFCKTLEEQLKDTQIIFLLGPRKCGKTVALKQIDKDNEKSNYTDIKMLDSNEKAEYIDKIISSINLDNEEPVKTNYNKVRRVYRGLFVSNNGININADVNGAYQIMKKVFPDAYVDGIQGVVLHPIRVSVA